MNYEKIITEVFHSISKEEKQGLGSSYIPELARVDPELFGV